MIESNFIKHFISINLEISEMVDKVNKTIYFINTPQNSSISLWEKNMPWVVALIVGSMTIGANLLISYHSRKTSKKILSDQLNHNKEIALEQIKNSQINAQKDFNKTVLSGNRQLLINQIREIISSILTKSSIFFLKEQLTTKDYDELKFLITKAELFMNPYEDKELLKSLKSIDSLCFEILSQGKEISNLEIEIELLKNETLKKIQIEWLKIIKGE